MEGSKILNDFPILTLSLINYINNLKLLNSLEMIFKQKQFLENLIKICIKSKFVKKLLEKNG